MRKIKNFLGITAWLAAMMLLALACSDGLDIHTRYLFDLETMPVPKRIAQGETVEIRCRLVKEGNFQDAKYHIRFFQTDGTGELRMDDGRVLTPNDLFPLTSDVFRLYYTSHCADQQTIDVYIEDDAGQVIQKTFSWQNDSPEGENDNETQKISFYDYCRMLRALRPLLAVHRL